MSYNPSTGIISVTSDNDGVSVRDVQRCVPVSLQRTNTSTGQVERVSSSDVGVLCSAIVGDTVTARDGKGNWTVVSRTPINKWAKYKPVASQIIDITGQWYKAQNRWYRNGDSGHTAATWWQNTSTRGSAGRYAMLYASCGLQYETFDSLGTPSSQDSFLYRLKEGDLPWTYVRPLGTSSNVLRITDFAGYFENAEAPISGNLPSEITADADGTGLRSFNLGFDCVATDDDQNLSLSHFKVGDVSLNNYFMGVLLYKSDTIYKIVTSESAIGEGGSADIHAKIGYDDTGRWKVFPFLSSKKITIDGTLPSGTFLSAGWGYDEGHSGINGGASIDIKGSENSRDISCYAMWLDSNRRTIIVSDVTLINRGSTSLSYNSVRIIVYSRPKNQPTADWQEVGGLSWTYYGSITVAARSTTNLPSTTKTYSHGSGSDIDYVEIDVVYEFTGVSYDSTKVYAVGAIAGSGSTLITTVDKEDIEMLFPEE